MVARPMWRLVAVQESTVCLNIHTFQRAEDARLDALSQLSKHIYNGKYDNFR